MPTDPPADTRRTSAPFLNFPVHLSLESLGCIGFGGATNSAVDFLYNPQPSPQIQVIQADQPRRNLATLLLGGAEVAELAALVKRLEAAGPNLHSYGFAQLVGRFNNQKKTLYFSDTPYDGLSLLNELQSQAIKATLRGKTVARFLPKPMPVPVDETALRQVREQLERVPGFTDVEKRFRVDLVRLQEDKYGVALVASLTPKRQGVLDTVEWHCPLKGGDGRQFLSSLEPVAQKAQQNRWLLRWRAAKRNREVLVRMRVSTSELVLIESGHEQPIARYSTGKA